MKNSIEVSMGDGPGTSAGSIVEMVASGPGCAQWRPVTGDGQNANGLDLTHVGRVIGVTKQVLAAGTPATLDCSTLAAGNLDSVVASAIAGTLGVQKTLQATGDSPPAGGVTIAVGGVWPALTYHIHYETAVSTVLDVENAITALGGGIVVATPGTPGTILNAPADDFVATPLAGGTNGIPGPVVTHGKIRNPAWTWVPGMPVYLNGAVLSQTDPVVPPGTGFNQQIGVAVEKQTITTDELDVDLGVPIPA